MHETTAARFEVLEAVLMKIPAFWILRRANW
jgi:hypothetical protein